MKPTALFFFFLFFPSQYSRTIPFQSTFDPVVIGNLSCLLCVEGGRSFFTEWFGNIRVLVCRRGGGEELAGEDVLEGELPVKKYILTLPG